MKKLFALTLLLGTLGFVNPAMADTKIAVVDIQALVNKSAQVQALKKENEAKAKEIQSWLKTVQADIKKQQTQEGKDKLVKKYETELKKKQEANSKAYAEKLKKIDKSITTTIVNEAKTKGYDLVITKQGDVLYGGLDITKDLEKVVK